MTANESEALADDLDDLDYLSVSAALDEARKIVNDGAKAAHVVLWVDNEGEQG